MMNRSASYFLRIRGKVIGPFGEAQLISLRDRGQFQPFHEVSADRIIWAPASTLTAVFSGSTPVERSIAAEAIAPASSGNRDRSKAKGSPPDEAALWYYINEAGKQTGPVGQQVIHSFIESSTIAEGTMLWKEGMGDWEVATRFFPERFAAKRAGGNGDLRTNPPLRAQKFEELKNTKLGTLLLIIAGFAGLICPPFGPVAFLLALIGAGFCMAAPKPAQQPAHLTFYLGLATALISVFWLIGSTFGWPILRDFVWEIQSGGLFKDLDDPAMREAQNTAIGASVAYLGFLILTFMVATGLFFASVGVLQYLLKMLAVLTGDTGLVKLAHINFIIYCVISGFLVCLFYVFLLLPFLFINGIPLFSALLMPKIVSVIFVMQTFLFFCGAICYIVTLVILMQLHGRFSKMSDALEE